MLQSWIVLLALTCSVASRKEVAVLLGGRTDNLVEIFTDREDTCVTDLDWSYLFSYAGAEYDAAGVYVDNDGIYVCGGQTAEFFSNIVENFLDFTKQISFMIKISGNSPRISGTSQNIFQILKIFKKSV